MSTSDEETPVSPPSVNATAIEAAQLRDIVPTAQIGARSAFGLNDWWSTNDYHRLASGGYSRDVDCDAGTIGDLAVAGVSLRGHKHTLDGKANEDAFALRVATTSDGDRYLVVVVCDGLSSAAHSSFAARRTSSLVADLLGRFVADPRFSLRRLKDNLERYLAKEVKPLLRTWESTPWDTPQWGAPSSSPLETDPKDLHVTLTFALVPAAVGVAGGSEAIIGAIGDSPCFLLHGGQWRRLGIHDPTDGGVLSTRTNAFPTSTAPEYAQLVLRAGDALCVASDGVGNFVEKDGQVLALGTYLAAQWSSPVDIPTFIRDASFDLRSADDDRTVVMCWLQRERPN